MVQYKGSHLSPRYRPLTGVPWQTLTAQAEPNALFDPLHPLLGTAGLAPQPTAWCHLCPLRLFSVQAATGIFFFFFHGSQDLASSAYTVKIHQGHLHPPLLTQPPLLTS